MLGSCLALMEYKALPPQNSHCWAAKVTCHTNGKDEAASHLWEHLCATSLVGFEGGGSL
jgi:hypothetical protein